ncbi:hypothetical protein BS17DRAFT_350913 [Gyrodon lividus]|nr:hypothetical protein BS17DRAFT_350913 [Gyrodon lividus]
MVRTILCNKNKLKIIGGYSLLCFYSYSCSLGNVSNAYPVDTAATPSQCRQRDCSHVQVRHCLPRVLVSMSDWHCVIKGRGNASRHRPGVQHVDYPVWRSEPVDRAPPPYEGLRLPPYTEENSGQELRSPPTARLEA